MILYNVSSQNETKIIEHGKTVTIIPSELNVDYIPDENPLYAELIFKGDNDESTPPEIIQLESDQLYVDGKRTHTFPDVNDKAIASLKLSKIIKWTNTNLFYNKEEEPTSQYLIQIDLKKDENVRKALKHLK